MKKLTKMLCGMALVFAVIGAACCVASLCFGFGSGELRQLRAAAGTRIRQAAEFLPSGEAGGNSGEDAEFCESYSGVDSLDLELSVSDCRLIPYDGDEVQVTAFRLPSGFSCKQSGGRLEIRTGEHVFGLFGLYRNASYLEIRVPEGLELERLKLEAGVGEITQEDGMLKCREADIECGVGSCALSLDVGRKLELECGVGEISLLLAGTKEDYNYRLECGIGEILVGEEEYSSTDDDIRFDHGADCDVRAECGVGSVELGFAAGTGHGCHDISAEGCDKSLQNGNE